MKRVMLLGVVVALALSGCGNPIPPGEIIEKEHESGGYTTVSSCTTDSKGKRTCTSKRMGKPECWELEIRDDKGNEHEVCVSEREWDKWNVGDRYPGSR